jgi:hypothetical protein
VELWLDRPDDIDRDITLENFPNIAAIPAVEKLTTALREVVGTRIQPVVKPYPSKETPVPKFLVGSGKS